MNYSVASNWDDELLNGLNNLNSKSSKDKVVEIFASSAFSFFGSANTGIPDIQKKEIETKIKKAKSLGFKFNYLVNAPVCPEIKTANDLKIALDYFSWLESLAIDSVTIADENIIEFVYNNFPKLKINVSIVAAIKTVEEVNNLRAKYPSIQRVILSQFVNRDRKLLLDHIKNSQIRVGASESIEIELLANEICIYECPRMRNHYLALSSFSQEKDKIDFDWALCRHIRADNINEFLNSSWIRPEDINLYEELGVNILKIAGRKEPTDSLLLRTAAYLQRSYKGNVMDLFLSEFWPNAEPPIIDNIELTGYIEKLWKANKKKIDSGEKTDIKYIWG